MKKIIFMGSLLLILSGCAPTNSVQTTEKTPTPIATPPAQTPPAKTPPAQACPTGQYACACATGSYCLRMGAMCLTPTSPCPVK